MRIKRWAALLLLVAGAALFGRGCPGPKRHAVEVDRPPVADAAAKSAPAPAGSGSDAKAAPRPRPLAATDGTVVRVRDGDSIVVLRGGVGVEVRLDGIDCPELAQAFGRKARKYTTDLAFGKSVRLAGKGKDRYDRDLAEVFLPDGRSLNRELIAAGFAWWYRLHSTDRTLGTLEQTARSARRGLWADENPVPPWDFRASNQRWPDGGPRRPKALPQRSDAPCCL